MENERWMSLLGLAARARKIISGEELVVKEIRNNKAKLVLISKDASQNTYKKITDKAAFYHVPVIEVENRTDLGHAIGKDARVVVAIMDTGFAKSMKSLFKR